ncbi:MAG: MerR family transcriptional regulator [Coprobacillus sp.]
MKIKEVEDMLQMNSQTIRYYDKLGFLHPHRDENGYRNYSKEDIMILKKIRFLRELDISLDMIEEILNNQDKFQNVLDQHINILQAQVENLEDIQQKCKELSQKSIPLLDAVVDGQFQTMTAYSDTKVNSIIKKAVEFMKPYSAITFGRKTTPYQLLKELIVSVGVSAFIGSIPFMMARWESGISLNWLIYIPSVIFGGLLIYILNFKEKYYEFKDMDFYVFNSHHQQLKSLRAIFNNTTHCLAQHYSYHDINHVTIYIEKKYGGIGYGVEKYFNIIFKFVMQDNNKFEINTSLYYKKDQDRKSVYEILEYHQVPIIDKQNFKQAIFQNELSLYDYLDKNI